MHLVLSQPAFETVRPIKGSLMLKAPSYKQYLFLLEGEYLYYYETETDTVPR